MYTSEKQVQEKKYNIETAHLANSQTGGQKDLQRNKWECMGDQDQSFC